MENITGIILLGIRIGLALSLFAFLGLSFLTMWRDIRQQAQVSAQRSIPPIKITVPSIHENDEEQEFIIHLSQAIVGRDPACECCIDHETVSSRHARFYFRLNQWWLEDLSSSNGTYINQSPLSTPTVLTNNDLLSFGQVVATVSILD